MGAIVVTGLVFGGPNMNELFVTSAKSAVQAVDGNIVVDNVSKSAGMLFKIVGLQATGTICNEYIV